MNLGKISVRYAKALFLTAKEQGIEDKVKEDLILISSAINDIPDFKVFLSNPVIKTSTKREIFNAIFKNKISALTNNFLSLLIKNKREEYLLSIVRSFDQQYKNDKGIKSAILTSAIPLGKEIKNSILKNYTEKLNIKIDLEEQINKNIIGGYILRIEDQQIDTSIASHLIKIKKELISSK